MVGANGAADGEVVVTWSVSEAPKVSGSYEFTIQQYSGTKGIGIGKSIMTTDFAIGGVKWAVRFYPDGYTAEDAPWVAFKLQRVHGTGDVRAEFAFHLLGPDGAVVHARISDRVCKFDAGKNNLWGIRRFVPRHQLESPGFGALHGDALAVRCTVTVYQKRSLRPRPARAAVAVPPSRYVQNNTEFLLSGREPFDVEFVVGGEVIGAHRWVVAAQSPYFDGLLYGHGREASFCRVAIDGTTPEVFRAVLHFIYHDELPPEEGNEERAKAMARELFAAGDMFLMERLKMMCARRMCRFVDDETAGAIGELAEAHSCVELAQGCRSYLARREISSVVD